MNWVGGWVQKMFQYSIYAGIVCRSKKIQKCADVIYGWSLISFAICDPRDSLVVIMLHVSYSEIRYLFKLYIGIYFSTDPAITFLNFLVKLGIGS